MIEIAKTFDFVRSIIVLQAWTRKNIFARFMFPRMRYIFAYDYIILYWLFRLFFYQYKQLSRSIRLSIPCHVFWCVPWSLQPMHHCALRYSALHIPIEVPIKFLYKQFLFLAVGTHSTFKMNRFMKVLKSKETRDYFMRQVIVMSFKGHNAFDLKSATSEHFLCLTFGKQKEWKEWFIKY